MFDFNFGIKSLTHLSYEAIWFSGHRGDSRVNKKIKAPINVE